VIRFAPLSLARGSCGWLLVLTPSRYLVDPDRTKFYLVMQLVEGVDLDQLLHEHAAKTAAGTGPPPPPPPPQRRGGGGGAAGGLPHERAVSLIGGCLQGLGAIHAAGLVRARCHSLSAACCLG
jgi:hypothetical protein